MRKLPDKYSSIQPVARQCALAYVVGPNKKHQLYEDAAVRFKDLAWGKKL